MSRTDPIRCRRIRHLEQAEGAANRLGRDEKRWFDFLSTNTYAVRSPPIADKLRHLAQKYPRLVSLEKSASPGVYFLASLTADGRAALEHARERYNRRKSDAS